MMHAYHGASARQPVDGLTHLSTRVLSLPEKLCSESRMRGIRLWRNNSMRRTKKLPPALKHGGYSASGLLPGEDPAAFEQLHKRLIAELAPNGALEDDLVLTIARRLWRKQNLATFRIAGMAGDRLMAIVSERRAKAGIKPESAHLEDEELNKIGRAAEAQARRELGDIYQLVEMESHASAEGLLKELAVEERLDAMIESDVKRLMKLKGFKSMVLPAQIAPPPRAPETLDV